MKHPIDPKVDCVFKALLGAPENSNLLIEFLNAILANYLTSPIVSVEILNPYNEREFLTDKLSIVDVKAEDQQKRIFQVEIQLSNYLSLPARMLYNWATVYSKQLKSGVNYRELKATYAIWLLNENLIADENYRHHFQLQDAHGLTLIDHCHIHVIELNKFYTSTIQNNEQRWLQFFKLGESLNDEALPDWMNTTTMRQAMSTLSRFSEKDKQFFAYHDRQEFLRDLSCREQARDEAFMQLAEARQELADAKQALQQQTQLLQQQAEAARQQAEAAQQQLAEKEHAAMAEIARLKALLADKNLN